MAVKAGDRIVFVDLKIELDWEIGWIFDNESVKCQAKKVGYLTHLTELSLDRNAIVDVSPLANLIHLKKLSLHSNSISDISPLTMLTQLRWLVIVGNPLNADASVHIPAMKAKGIQVRFDYRKD